MTAVGAIQVILNEAFTLEGALQVTWVVSKVAPTPLGTKQFPAEYVKLAVTLVGAKQGSGKGAGISVHIDSATASATAWNSSKVCAE